MERELGVANYFNVNLRKMTNLQSLHAPCVKENFLYKNAFNSQIGTLAYGLFENLLETLQNNFRLETAKIAHFLKIDFE